VTTSAIYIAVIVSGLVPSNKTKRFRVCGSDTTCASTRFLICVPSPKLMEIGTLNYADVEMVVVDRTNSSLYSQMVTNPA
jgi:hypothetical protein